MDKKRAYHFKRSQVVWTVVLLLVVASCKKPGQNGWDTELLTPLAHTNVDINNIVADSLLGAKPDSALSLVYRETIYEFDPTEDLLKIPDTSLVNNLKLDSLVPMANPANPPYHSKSGAQPFELFRKDDLLVYDFNGPELTFFEVRSGELKIFITSTLRDTLRFEFIMDEAKDDNGEELRATDKVPPASPNGSSTVQRSFDLSGYEVDLRGPNDNSVNTIQPVIVGKIDSLGSIGNITQQDSVYISYELTDIIPQYVKGYLGKDTVDVGQKITDFSAFESVKSGMFSIDEVSARFTVTNGLGVEGEVLVNALSAIKGNQQVGLNSPVTDQPIKVTRAYDNPRVNSTTEVAITDQNSNITEMLELMPSRFYYHIDAFINPQGNLFNYQDFGYYDSPFDVYFDVEVPLRIRLQDVLMADTTDFNLGLAEDELENIKKGQLNLITYNSFPYEIDVQMFLYDEQNALMDSLFIENTIDGGLLNDSCRVTERRRTLLTSEVSGERLERLQQARKAVITATFANPQTPPFCSQRKLQLYSDYNIDMTLSARFQYFLKDAF